MLVAILLVLGIVITNVIVNQGWLETHPNNSTINHSNVEVTFLDATELAKRLGVSQQTYHKKIKRYIKSDFKDECQKIDTLNPDVGINHEGNIVLRNPKTGQTIETDVPLDSYKGVE
jgi:hypothetical protein